MKNKIEFSADGRDICRFLTIVFILTLVIGIAVSYGYYAGSDKAIEMGGFVMMLIPTLSVILTVRWNKTKIYPKKIFDFYQITAFLIFLYVLISIFMGINLPSISGIGRLLSPEGLFSENIFSIIVGLTNFFLIFFIYKNNQMEENKELMKSWKLSDFNFKKILQCTCYFIVLKNILIISTGVLCGNIDFVWSMFDYKFWLKEIIVIPTIFLNALFSLVKSTVGVFFFSLACRKSLGK